VNGTLDPRIRLGIPELDINPYPADDSEFDLVVSDRRLVAEGVAVLTSSTPGEVGAGVGLGPCVRLGRRLRGAAGPSAGRPRRPLRGVACACTIVI
jgi:hypothetical protein